MADKKVTRFYYQFTVLIWKRKGIYVASTSKQRNIHLERYFVSVRLQILAKLSSRDFLLGDRNSANLAMFKRRVLFTLRRAAISLYPSSLPSVRVAHDASERARACVRAFVRAPNVAWSLEEAVFVNHLVRPPSVCAVCVASSELVNARAINALE